MTNIKCPWCGHTNEYELSVKVSGIVHDANEENFGDLLDEDTNRVRLQDYNTSDCDYYITEITLISGEYWYASMNSIGEIVFTGEPLLTHWKNVNELGENLDKNIAVESFEFKVN